VTPSSAHWIVGLALAVGAHVLTFSALGYHEPQALVDDAFSTVISVAGSLDDYASDAEPLGQDSESDVEALDDFDEVEAEPISENEPEDATDPLDAPISPPQELEPEVVETISEAIEPEPAEVAAEPVEVTPEPVEMAPELVEPQAAELTPEQIEPETIEDTPEEIEPETVVAVPPPKPVVKTVVQEKPQIVRAKKAPPKVDKRRQVAPKKAPGKKAAQRGTSRGASQGSTGGLSASAKQAVFAKYKARVRSRIVRRVRSTRGRGTVVVRFTIAGGGSVSGSRVVRSSNASLNNAALKAVGGRFPPIPSELPRTITLTVPIAFK